MKLLAISRRWLPQSEITSWDGFLSEMEQKLRDKENRLKIEAEGQSWRFNSGVEPFITLSNRLEIRPLASRNFEMRDSEGQWVRIANPKKDIPSGDLISLQKSSELFIEVVNLRQAVKDLPAALAEFRREYQQHLDALATAKSPVTLHEALQKLRAFYGGQEEVLPLNSRKELLEAEFQVLLKAFRNAASTKESDDLQNQLRDFLREHRDLASCEEEYVGEQNQKDYRKLIEALRNAASLEKIERARTQLVAFANRYKDHLPGAPPAEIEAALNHALENNIPPPPPASLRASGARAEGISVFWNRSHGAVEYQIFRSDSIAPETKFHLDSVAASAAASPNPSFLDASAAAGRDYFYWVKASNHMGESDFAGPARGRRAGPVGPSLEQIMEEARKDAEAADPEKVEKLIQTYPDLRDKLLAFFERAQKRLETRAHAISAADEGNVLKLAEIYSGDLEYGDNLMVFLESALENFLKQSEQESKSARTPEDLEALRVRHTEVDASLKRLLKLERLPRRITQIHAFIIENTGALKGIDLIQLPPRPDRRKEQVFSQAKEHAAAGRPANVKKLMEANPPWAGELEPLMQQALRTLVNSHAAAAASADEIEALDDLLKDYRSLWDGNAAFAQELRNCVDQAAKRVERAEQHRKEIEFEQKAKQRRQFEAQAEAAAEARALAEALAATKDLCERAETRDDITAIKDSISSHNDLTRSEDFKKETDQLVAEAESRVEARIFARMQEEENLAEARARAAAASSRRAVASPGPLSDEQTGRLPDGDAAPAGGDPASETGREQTISDANQFATEGDTDGVLALLAAHPQWQGQLAPFLKEAIRIKIQGKSQDAAPSARPLSPEVRVEKAGDLPAQNEEAAPELAGPEKLTKSRLKTPMKRKHKVIIAVLAVLAVLAVAAAATILPVIGKAKDAIKAGDDEAIAALGKAYHVPDFIWKRWLGQAKGVADKVLQEAQGFATNASLGEIEGLVEKYPHIQGLKEFRQQAKEILDGIIAKARTNVEEAEPEKIERWIEQFPKLAIQLQPMLAQARSNVVTKANDFVRQVRPEKIAELILVHDSLKTNLEPLRKNAEKRHADLMAEAETDATNADEGAIEALQERYEHLDLASLLAAARTNAGKILAEATNWAKQGNAVEIVNCQNKFPALSNRLESLRIRAMDVRNEAQRMAEDAGLIISLGLAVTNTSNLLERKNQLEELERRSGLNAGFKAIYPILQSRIDSLLDRARQAVLAAQKFESDMAKAATVDDLLDLLRLLEQDLLPLLDPSPVLQAELEGELKQASQRIAGSRRTPPATNPPIRIETEADYQRKLRDYKLSLADLDKKYTNRNATITSPKLYQEQRKQLNQQIVEAPIRRAVEINRLSNPADQATKLRGILTSQQNQQWFDADPAFKKEVADELNRVAAQAAAWNQARESVRHDLHVLAEAIADPTGLSKTLKDVVREQLGSLDRVANQCFSPSDPEKIQDGIKQAVNKVQP
jgi:hypothetical protein